MEVNVRRNMALIGQVLQRAGPYVLIEILLPGGTLLALLLLLYRLGPAKVSAEAQRIGAAAVLRMSTALARRSMRVQAYSAGWVGPAAQDGRDGLEPLGFAPS
jgi:hypothetical protein